MNETINWGLVKARPLIDSIPQEAVESMKIAQESNENIVDKIWGKIWPRNLKANVKKVGDLDKYGVGYLEGTNVGKTAYLVGAGPSLKYNVNEIPKDGKIFTSGHSVKYLLKNGVKPDYVGIVDAYDRQAEWCDIGDESKDITLLMDINCTPKMFKVWKGPIVFFRTVANSKSGLSEELWKISDMSHMVGCGGNVMSAMMTCAMMMGSKRIIFIGHDYCSGISDGIGVTYADGSRDTGRWVRMPKEKKFDDTFIDVDIQGKGVMTLGRMWGYKFWTELMAQRYVKEGFSFINATEGGILGSYFEGNLNYISQQRLAEV